MDDGNLKIKMQMLLLLWNSDFLIGLFFTVSHTVVLGKVRQKTIQKLDANILGKLFPHNTKIGMVGNRILAQKNQNGTLLYLSKMLTVNCSLRKRYTSKFTNLTPKSPRGLDKTQMCYKI